VRAVTVAWGRIRQLPPAAILAAGWTVFVLYAFPGVMTMDSFDQLREGRDWYFTDSHPPAMAALWGIVDRVISGPFGMLLIQGTSFLAGLYLILRHAMSPRRAAACACALLLFPPVLAPMAVIWKDCVMAGCFVLGIAGLLESCKWRRLAGLAALSLATAMRYNAPAATFPLILMLFEWQPGRRWLVRYALAGGAWLAVTGAAFGCNAMLVDQPMHLWQSSLALEDIVGTLAHVEPELPDRELGPLLAPTGVLVDRDYHARLRAKYLPYDFQPLISGDGHLWDVPLNGSTPAPEPVRDAISHAWWVIVTGHPGAYVAYRLEAFEEAIGITHRHVGAMVVPHGVQYAGMLDHMGLANYASRFTVIAERVTMYLAKHTRLFRPHAYLLLSLGLLVLCRRHREVAAILLSGLALELSLLPLVPTPDYRYSHWMVTCACLSLVMLLARRARAHDIGTV
jgi:hypothetical protein